MLSPRPKTLLRLAARQVRTARQIHAHVATRLGTASHPVVTPIPGSPVQARTASHAPWLIRWASNKAVADEKIEEITELFATAKDEFEIAMEETEKQTVYAEDDRAAAREELDKVQAAYKAVVEGPDKELAKEVSKRIGQRIRELEQGVKAMEELAQNQD